MVKGKFIYVYGDGRIMSDANGYKSLATARNYAKRWNQRTKNKKDKIVNVLSK